ncbi:MAG: TatD family hydrolase [Candidatus Micrarchaeia archaeon]|jgi:TatD DNase family protein
MSSFVDAHCHLTHELFAADLPEVLERARKAGVEKVYCVSGMAGHDERVLDLAARHPGFVFPVLGVSPHDAPKTSDEQLKAELARVEENKEQIAAVGEIGFEFHYFKGEAEREAQRKIFRAQLELAEQLGKAVVVHSRKATKETLDELAGFNGKVMLHCCNDALLAREGAQRGYLVSVSTLKSRERQKIIAETPLESLCCETDSPFLSPEKGKRNEPANVVAAYEAVAVVKGISLSECAEKIYLNLKRFFR